MKKISLFLAVCLSLVTFNAMGSTDFTTTDYGTFGIWSVKAYHKADGSLLNCSIVKHWDNGNQTLIYVGYRGEYENSGETRQVHLADFYVNSNRNVGNSGISYKATIGSNSWNGYMVNKSPTEVDIGFPYDSTFINALETNSLMTIVYSSGVTNTYNLVGLNQAWPVMMQCRASNGMNN